MSTLAGAMPGFSMSLRSDPFGRIDKIIKPRRQLQPLFEAISNSIYSARRQGNSAPEIRVFIDRDDRQQHTPDSPPSSSITRLLVEDNGEGFTDVNCESFCSTDSRYKKQSGGKGIGRLLWLKTFKHVEVSSVFKVGGNPRRRAFHFKSPKEGMNFFSNVNQEDCAADTPQLTTVSLVSPLSVLRRTTDELAYEIIAHFLNAFTSRPAVSFTLVDKSASRTIDLNALFTNEISVEDRETTFKVGVFAFSVRHCLMSNKAAKQHSLHLCAEGLPVIQVGAERSLKIPHAAIAQKDGIHGLYYSGYISAKLLDERHNQERQAFDLPTKDQILLANEPTIEAIQRVVAKEAKKFLTPHLRDFKKQNMARVRDYIASNPGYRHLLTQERAALEMIPADTSDKSLDLLLYKVDKKNEVKERYRAVKLLASIKRNRSDLDLSKLLKQVNRLLSDVNEASRARLAEYVIRRRVTLQFLHDILGPTDNTPISLEDAVHNLIFPMRSTSDDVRLDETNLWIIDERFAYHKFLSSDKVAFKNATAVRVGAGDRPEQVRHDLLIGFTREDIFNHSLASSSDSMNLDAIAIVEFKKPQRDDYTSAKNPIQQTTEYARDIRNGIVYNYRKQKIEIPPQQPIFCYMICDLTPSLKEIASDRGFESLPGGDGFFFINSPLNMFQTIVSYRKLLVDATRRNDALFERLHIRSELGSLDSLSTLEDDASQPSDISY